MQDITMLLADFRIIDGMLKWTCVHPAGSARSPVRERPAAASPPSCGVRICRKVLVPNHISRAFLATSYHAYTVTCAQGHPSSPRWTGQHRSQSPPTAAIAASSVQRFPALRPSMRRFSRKRSRHALPTRFSGTRGICPCARGCIFRKVKRASCYILALIFQRNKHGKCIENVESA